MKAALLLLACLFALNTQASPDFSPLQREAVRFMIEESGERSDSENFVEYLRLSKVMTRKELKRFPEVLVHKDYHYVLIKLDDCVYDVVIVVVDPDGKAVSSLYVDFSDRGKTDW
jgi:hypothetical protein